MTPRVRYSTLVILVALFAVPVNPGTPAVCASPSVSDSLYNANHPRLLFTADELPALRIKVLDGGPDDPLYATLRNNVATIYAGYPATSTTGLYFGVETIPELGIVGWVEQPMDSTAMAVGRWLTNYVASDFQPDFNEANSGMRLRTLALGYDMFFAEAPDSERCLIRDEMVSYMSLMTGTLPYELFEYPPYLANHSVMFGASLGLAAIALWDEVDPAITSASLAMADRICDAIITRMIDDKGSYYEGGFYGMWALKLLSYYFDARLRFDGFDYSADPRLRRVEEWIAYELLPEGSAHTLNLNDSMYITRAFATAPTFLAWATTRWNSGLSAWLWYHIAGPFGWTGGGETDKAGSVLWHRNIPAVHPSQMLPNRRVFPGRGLYHFRTGWQTGPSSDDVIFAFYSGKFEGGHAQEDQNQFVLHGFGERFIVDHGAGGTAKQSQSHNMVFVAGNGQHNAGGSIGTDGQIVSQLITPFADYLKGDATAAYGTHSPYNELDQPVPGVNWAWGLFGENPVDYAHRHVLAVDDGTRPPWFAIMDDIQRDGNPTYYSWRVHTADTNSVDISGSPVVITGPSGATMDMLLLRPDPALVTVAAAPYDNASPEPDATLITFGLTAIDPGFVTLMFPRPAGAAPPGVTTAAPSWGVSATIDWGGGVVDYFLRNDSGGPVNHGPLSTNARVAVIRTGGAQMQWTATEMDYMIVDGVTWAFVGNGPVGCSRVGSSYYLDRNDADFHLRDEGATAIYYRDQSLPFATDPVGYLVPLVVASADIPHQSARRLLLSAHPNPFNPTTTIRALVPVSGQLNVTLYDVAGRTVRRLFNGSVKAGERLFTWDGNNDAGRQAASGTYFVVAQSETSRFVTKLTLLK